MVGSIPAGGIIIFWSKKMKKITAILTQRSDDYHISVKGMLGIWDSGKTLKKAIDNFKRLLVTNDYEMETLEVNVNSITEITW